MKYQCIDVQEHRTQEERMDTTPPQETAHEHSTPQSTGSVPLDKQPWQEPKLAFVEPKLTPHGELQKVTGFFGPFTPLL